MTIVLREAESDLRWSEWRMEHWPSPDTAQDLVAATNRAINAWQFVKDTAIIRLGRRSSMTTIRRYDTEAMDELTERARSGDADAPYLADAVDYYRKAYADLLDEYEALDDLKRAVKRISGDLIDALDRQGDAWSYSSSTHTVSSFASSSDRR